MNEMNADSHYQHPPAFCPEHGIFPATLMRISNSIDIELSGAAPCPQCGRAGEILPGIYDVIGPRMNIALSASVDPMAKAALLEILRDVASGQIDTEAAARRAEDIKPGLGRMFAGLSPGMRQTLVGGLFAVLTAGIGYKAVVDGARTTGEYALEAAKIRPGGATPPHPHTPPDIRPRSAPPPDQPSSLDVSPVPPQKPSRQVRRKKEREAKKKARRNRGGIDI